jgi:AcrR family transcriptional regulator
MKTKAGTPTRRRVAHRTQQERREETVGKLLQGTIDALADVGYARTSVSEICSRAGVSHGALFCHFDSRLELIAAAADEVARRHLARLRAEFEPAANMTGADSDRLARVIGFLDAAAHSRMNAVWHELLVASRTDEGLRPAVRSVMRRYAAQIEAAAAALFGADEYDPALFRSAVWGLVSIFDGLALTDALDFGESHPRADIVRSAPEIARLVLSAVAGGTAKSRGTNDGGRS